MTKGITYDKTSCHSKNPVHPVNPVKKLLFLNPAKVEVAARPAFRLGDPVGAAFALHNLFDVPNPAEHHRYVLVVERNGLCLPEFGILDQPRSALDAVFPEQVQIKLHLRYVRMLQLIRFLDLSCTTLSSGS
jgi:hypothetical protein